MAAVVTDNKSLLNRAVQKAVARPVTKTDILYAVHPVDGGHQCIVKLDCLNGQEFAGEVAVDKKTSEHNAALQALSNAPELAEHAQALTGGAGAQKRKLGQPAAVAPAAKIQKIGLLNGNTAGLLKGNGKGPQVVAPKAAAGKGKSKGGKSQEDPTNNVCWDFAKKGVCPRQTKGLECKWDHKTWDEVQEDTGFAAPAGGDIWAAPPGEGAGHWVQVAVPAAQDTASPKLTLNSVAGKCVRRALNKGEIAFETTEAEGGYMSTCTMTCIEGQLAGQSFPGEVQKSKKDAEQSAAQVVLDAIYADADLVALLNAPKAKKPKAPKEASA